jgi:2-oxoglutarate dehydrogenase complex dehydrogenase (E1) component-like enzyme
MPEIKQYPEAFGPNAWLIEEMYRQFREQPDTVTESWRDFFEDYRPLSAPTPAKLSRRKKA